MKAKKRILSLMLSILMLCTLLPQPLHAAQTVYFTSANDMLLDLNDETMPFWQGSTLYVASSVFDRNKTDLGTTYSRSRDKMTAIIYRSRDVLVFDLAAGTIENNSTHEVLSGSAVVRGDVVFVPVNTVAKFFGFDYSCVKIDYGYLVRVKSESVVLSDAAFIDAASAPMEQRYNQYEKTHSSASGNPQNSETAYETEKGSAYLLIDVSDKTASENIVATLSNTGVLATFLMSKEQIEQMPDLVRGIIVNGSTIALKINASDGKKTTLSAIEQANEALWTASNTKTRFVLLQNAAEAVNQEAAAMGYCPIAADVKYENGLPSSSRIASNISVSVSRTGQCIADLGEDTVAQGIIGGLLSLLRTGGCSVQHINEIATRS